VLELQGASVRYGGFTAVQDITFEVPDGQFVAVVGPTGCGKSSLLNLVAGLLAPAEGSVRTGGRPVTTVNRDCGYMFQSDALLPWKTALDNVLLGPVLRGMPKAEARNLALQWLGRVGLADFQDRYPHQLSGGQRKRVAMAQVLGLVMFAGKSHPDAKTIKDMANLKIGITSAGSSTEEMVKFLFKKNGMDPAAAQTVAVGSGGPAITALKNGVVDALVTVEPAASTIEKNGDGTVLYDTRTEQGTRDVFGGAWPAGGFYAPTDFVQQNPRTAQALARVAVDTLKYIQSHSAEDIAAKLPGQLFYPDSDQAAFAKVLGANLKMFSPDGKMPADGPTNVLETLKAADTQTDWSKVDLSKTFTNSLVETVK
jgi:predicted ABC-type transport system involved in lysophospholipase L1 biosynthesis ATPase subunit